MSAQKIGGTYSQSSSDYASYLEKENKGLDASEMEHFFNQYSDEITKEEVMSGIDGNTAKLKKKEPKFYSITVSPSKYELSRLQNSSQDLKTYTREIMKDYVQSFNRDLNGRPITINDIMYYAKIEHIRTFKGTDKRARENQPFAINILELKHQIRRVRQGKFQGNIKRLESKIEDLENQAPHKQNGKRITQGMVKEGNQSHIHIIVSRKDASNSISLSPGSKYKSSEVMMNGKIVKRGFDRDHFFAKAEKTFDITFKYKRNYAESYTSKKDFIKNPKLYFSTLLGLPASEKALAFKILGNAGVPMLSIPTSKVQLALKSIRYLKQGIQVALKSGSIGI